MNEELSPVIEFAGDFTLTDALSLRCNKCGMEMFVLKEQSRYDDREVQYFTCAKCGNVVSKTTYLSLRS